MRFSSMHRRHQKHRHEIGKKAVYMTDFRPAAVEVKKMYDMKCVKAEIATEKGEYGKNMYVVYVFLGHAP